MSNSNLVFVYGSLMQGYHNHDIIAFDFDTHERNKGYDYHGKTITVDRFKMYDCGSFPAISFDETDDGSGYPVSGELYSVDDKTFELLDTLEGYPGHYNRKQVTLKNGAYAWIYFYDSVDSDATEYDNVVNGVYKWEL